MEWDGATGLSWVLDGGNRMSYVVYKHTTYDCLTGVKMRIGVNIPKELHQRLQPLKETINISQICREALEAKVEKYERMKARLDGDEFNAVVDRLGEREKEFLNAIDFDWELLGYEDAASWTKAASWDDWDYVLEDLAYLKERNLPHWQVMHPRIAGIKSFHDRDMEMSYRIGQVREQHRNFDRWINRYKGGIDRHAIEQEYMTAWIRHVKAVWELVRQRELEDLDRQLAQRPAPPEPEVPEHLFGDTRTPGQQGFRVVPHRSRLIGVVDPAKLNRLINDPDLGKSFEGEDEAQ